MRAIESPEECTECGHPGRTYPTPFAAHLCVPCFETWLKDKDEVPPLRWLVQCVCGKFVKSTSTEQRCECSRLYAVFKVW